MSFHILAVPVVSSNTQASDRWCERRCRLASIRSAERHRHSPGDSSRPRPLELIRALRLLGRTTSSHVGILGM
jgi:hypothetical protein